MLVAALTAIGVALGVAAVPPPGEPLDIAVVDESGFPTVVVDVVVPAPWSTVEITADMVSVDGVAVNSLERVDPTTTALALVIDDRPTIDDLTVEAEQGASVELARNLGEGAQVALFTPSGLRSALTADRGATIARISGIIAGAPDVVPLPELLLDAATTLAESTLPDRHLVVVLGGELSLDDAQLTALRSSLSSSGTRVHAVAPNGPGPLADLAAATGGLAPATTEAVAAMDRITSAIDDRYRAVATVAAPGGHEVAVEVEGNRFTAPIDVAPAAPATTPPATAPASPPPRASATATTFERTPVATTELAVDEPLATSAPAEAAGDDGSSLVLPAILAILVLAVAGAFVLVLRRRSGQAASAVSPRAVMPASAPDDTAEAAPAMVPEPAPETSCAVTPSVGAEAVPEPEAQPETRPEIPPGLVVLPPPRVVLTAVPDQQPKPEPAAATVPASSRMDEPEPSEPEPASEAVPATQSVDARDETPRRRATRRGPTPLSGPRGRPSALPEREPELEPEVEPVPTAADVDVAPPRRTVKPLSRPRVRPQPAVPAEPPRREVKPLLLPRVRDQVATSPEAAAPAPVPEPPADDRAPSWLVSGKLRMRLSTGEVWSGNRRVDLNHAERRVLELLLTQGGHGLTSESILEAAGLPPDEGREASDAIIATVRRKTGTTGRKQTVLPVSDGAVLEDVTTDVTAAACESNRSLSVDVERTGFSCEGSSSGPRQAYVHFQRSDTDDTDYRISAQPVGGFPSNFGWPALENGNRTPLAQVPWPGAEAGAPAATVSFFVIDENNNRAVLHHRLTWGDVLAAPGCAAIFA